MLEFANTFPAEFNWEDYDWETAESEYSRLQNGKQLMTTCYLSSFPDVQVQYAFHGGDVNFIGYPSENGKGSCFTLGTTMSISSACDEPELAWSFVRELLLAENQTEEQIWQFPTNKAAFDAYVKERMTPEYTTDPETGEQVEVSNHGYSIGNDFEVQIYSLKQEELDAFMALYENCTGIYTYDQEIMDIIREECAPFFAGQKTAEETAKLIQNRIGLYVAERM
jgi:ABC-type glycerol-3-phosphate transport system substrate-binding protein